jgi:microcystin-dependent protein
MNLLINYGIRASAGGKESIEPGLIVMWYGTEQTVPDGWALCDGQNDTPNLINQFVVGAGSSYSISNTGGSVNATLVSHTHGASTGATNPSSHPHVLEHGMPNANGTRLAYPEGAINVVGTVGTGAGGNHSHSGSYTFGTTGSSATNANLPPYYGLFYIISVGGA